MSWKWTPTGEELQKYRRSWNPMANGPILNTSVDVQPKGQFLIEPFVFGEFGHQKYDNKLTTASSDSKDHAQAIAPTFIFAYGLTDHLEIDVIPAGASTLWWQDNQAASNGRARSQTFGPGNTTIYLKNQLRVQDPDSWQPTITQFHQVVLPSSQWLGTPGIPGGFSPLGRLPATKFGALSYTEGLMFRKNLQPFRISAGVYYTYTAPGRTAGMNTYVGDIVNTRLRGGPIRLNSSPRFLSGVSADAHAARLPVDSITAYASSGVCWPRLECGRDWLYQPKYSRIKVLAITCPTVCCGSGGGAHSQRVLATSTCQAAKSSSATFRS